MRHWEGNVLLNKRYLFISLLSLIVCLLSVVPVRAAETTQVSSVFAGLKVYPNPWRIDKHANTNVTFAPLPSGSTVKIYTVSGHWVKTLGSDGLWDVTNDNGAGVASGVFLYVVTAPGTSDIAEGKIIVIK